MINKDIILIDKYLKNYKKLYNKKKYDELLYMINGLIYKYDNDEFNGMLLKHKGYIYSIFKDYENAINLFLESLHLSNNIDVKDYLASAYYFNKNYDIAKKIFIELIEIGRADVLIFIYLLDILIKENNFKKAFEIIKHNKQRVRKYFNDPDFLMQYAILLKKINRLTKSIIYFKKSLNKGNNNIYINYEIGECYCIKKDYKKALKYFKLLLKKDPLEKKNYYNLGELYKELGYLKKSKYYLEKYDILCKNELNMT